MKKLLIIGAMLVGTSAFAQLSTATGARLTDYTNWFGDFKVASDKTFPGEPSPINLTPPAGITTDRLWTGWYPNTAPSGVITGSKYINSVEIVFLGETAGWWDDLGYTLNGTDHLLADGVQAFGGSPNRAFGDYAYFKLDEGETLDFFVTGSGVYTQDGVVTVGPYGGKYSVFSNGANSYWGTLVPLTSVRNTLTQDFTSPAWSVFGVEDISPVAEDGTVAIPPNWKEKADYNDFLFAVRYGWDIPQGPVPEPSTYGLIGAAALLGLIAYRRFKKV